MENIIGLNNKKLKTQPSQNLLLKILDGPIEEIPNYRQPNPFITFKRKEEKSGMMVADNLVDNVLAGHCLAKIGFFLVKKMIYMSYMLGMWFVY